MKEEICVQKSFFQTGFPLLGAALAVLGFSMYLLLQQFPLVLPVILLAAGIVLIVLGLRSGKRESERILRFIREESAFRHPCGRPLTAADLLERLRQEGFTVTEYPSGNCHGYREFGAKCGCHFFLSNNDAPDPDFQEDGGFAELFVQIHLAASLTPGKQFLVNLKYGPGLEQKSAAFLKAAQKGFLHDKDGDLFGFCLAWDTQDNILYCAEAVRRVVWQKNDVFARFVSELVGSLFFSSGERGGG